MCFHPSFFLALLATKESLGSFHKMSGSNGLEASQWKIEDANCTRRFIGLMPGVFWCFRGSFFLTILEVIVGVFGFKSWKVLQNFKRSSLMNRCRSSTPQLETVKLFFFRFGESDLALTLTCFFPAQNLRTNYSGFVVEGTC